VTPLPSPAVDTRHFTAQGIDLDYPASWYVSDDGWPSTGFGSTWAVLGTMPWGDCAAGDLNCHYQVRLAPGEITLQLGIVTLTAEDLCELGASRPDLAARGAGDPVATGSLVRVGGRPAVRTDYVVGGVDYYRADEWRGWKIAAPGSTRVAYTIDAMYRGPELDGFHTDLDRLIASIRLRPSSIGEGALPPDDCGPPFPAAGSGPWGPLAVTDEDDRMVLAARGGAGPLGIGQHCVTLLVEEVNRELTLVWRNSQASWDPAARQIGFDDVQAGHLTLADGDRIEVGGAGISEPGAADQGARQPTWISTPDSSCPSELWAVHSVKPIGQP
jgi:hypothetical protein